MKDGAGTAQCSAAPAVARALPITLALGILRAYQLLISPWLPRSCRFAPSCSAYACEAIERHGLGRGLALAGRRLFRCHPWHVGGYDPVP